MITIRCVNCRQLFNRPGRYTHPTHLCVTMRDPAHVTPVTQTTTAQRPSIAGAVVYSFETGRVIS